MPALPHTSQATVYQIGAVAHAPDLPAMSEHWSLNTQLGDGERPQLERLDVRPKQGWAAVIADMALEVEAALMLVMRVARSFDDPDAPLGRIITAIAKYWVNKRTPALVYEAMECLGGGGYVEESILPRLYREAPLNSIWEGSGNVIALDVLRALHRQPETRDALVAEVEPVRGSDTSFDVLLDDVLARLAPGATLESEGRLLAERLALLLQGALMLQRIQ